MDLIAAIESVLSINDLRSPILLHTLVRSVLFDGFTNDDRFISRYRNDCPATPFSGMSGFVGVLRYEDAYVPVVSLFVQDNNFQDKPLLVDLPRFAKWDQYVPMDGEEEQPYISDLIYIKITDLNIDNVRRETLIRENPPWLNDQADKDRFLRSRIIVNVYEKFLIQVLDRSAAVAWDVTSEGDAQA
jgi:hypothetical protein